MALAAFVAWKSDAAGNNCSADLAPGTAAPSGPFGVGRLCPIFCATTRSRPIYSTRTRHTPGVLCVDFTWATRPTNRTDQAGCRPNRAIYRFEGATGFVYQLVNIPDVPPYTIEIALSAQSKLLSTLQNH